MAYVLGKDFQQMMTRWSRALYGEAVIGGADPLLGFASWACSTQSRTPCRRLVASLWLFGLAGRRRDSVPASPTTWPWGERSTGPQLSGFVTVPMPCYSAVMQVWLVRL